MSAALRGAVGAFTSSLPAVKDRRLNNRPSASTVSLVSAPLRSTRCKAKAETAVDAAMQVENEDFYSLLGVDPNASSKEVRRAYLDLIRVTHPDQVRSSSFSSSDDDGAAAAEERTAFCSMLNDVYETLSDPVKRGVYNHLAGFSSTSINPFHDKTFAADQVFVDEVSCIGCTMCTAVCPKAFVMEPDFGRARVMKQGAYVSSQLQDALDACPVSCIHWVTAPQLSLLEAAMSRMERTAVWAIMSYGGDGKDVFSEASLAWEKRQSTIRGRVQAAAPLPRTWGFWNNAVSFTGASGSRAYSNRGAERTQYSDSFGDGTGAQTGDDNSKESRTIAALAARAARASRVWRKYQDSERRKRGLGLLEAEVSHLV